MIDVSGDHVNCIEIDNVQIIYGDFFTKEMIAEWTIFIAECCRGICEGYKNKVDPKYEVDYFLSESLLNEVVGDAVIGMSKIIEKTPHHIERPNAFKIAAYLGYWFLRHKPISILYPYWVNLNEIEVASGVETDVQYLSWQLKHINEAVAVNIVTTYIFNFEQEVCKSKQCRKVKKQITDDGESVFAFKDFNQQRQVMLQKLTYYFAYRAIAPKVIEHMLEGYAFHPAWNLTGPHWNTGTNESITEISEKPSHEND